MRQPPPLGERTRVAAAVAVAVGLPVTALPAVAQAAGYDQRLDLTFPVRGPASFVDTYHAARGGGARVHEATDIFGSKLQRVVAARAGTVCAVSGLDGREPDYGYMVTVCGDDGRQYHYIHLNNDTPGTDDGRGGPAHAYAPGIRPGVRVARGQWLGYLGDSGNAETTPPHLHFEIEDPRLRDARVSGGRYRGDRLNPYPSLVAAVGGSGRVSAGSTAGVRLGARGDAVAAWQADLRRSGARIVVDGVFGPATHAATIAFQRRHGLVGDGIVGPATRGAMARALATAVPVSSAAPLASGQVRLLRLATPWLRGADVAAWQRVVGVPADGVFGPVTDAATRAFQRRAGVAVDGVVGPRTRAAAGVGTGTTAVARHATGARRVLRMTTPLLRGDDVRAWQQRMRDRGWAIAVDGIYGPHSAEAARQFQQRFGLVVDGVVGPATWQRTFS